jgi:hypothetical protein
MTDFTRRWWESDTDWRLLLPEGKPAHRAKHWGRRQKHGSWRRQTQENPWRRMEEDRKRDLREMVTRPLVYIGHMN